jgi:hypothetical protein
MRFLWLLAVAAVPVYPTAPTLLVFRARDFGGKVHPNVTVKTQGAKLRIEAFGAVLLYDGKIWHSEGDVGAETEVASAFIAAIDPGSGARRDSFGRPLLIPSLRAGSRKARVDYRYDEVGLLSVNVTYSDGNGLHFRRVSALPAVFTPADFQPPQRVEPQQAAAAAATQRGPAVNWQAVERLMALSISEKELSEFESAGRIGPFRALPQ